MTDDLTTQNDDIHAACTPIEDGTPCPPSACACPSCGCDSGCLCGSRCD